MGRKKQPGHKNKREQERLKKGRLEITRSGLGYVVIDKDDEGGDILVRPNDFNNALNGDTVRVKVIKESAGTRKREGRITEVITRKQTEFIGRIQLSANFAFFIVDSDKATPDFYIPLDKLNGAKNNDHVTVRLVRWDKEDKKPVGEVLNLLDATQESDMAMKSLLAENGFPLAFPDDVVEETERIPDTITKACLFIHI